MWCIVLFAFALCGGSIHLGVAGYNILVTSMGASGSQNLIMYRLAEHLADRGHDVTVLKAEVFAEAKTAPLKRARELKYTAVRPDTVDSLKEIMWAVPWQQSDTTPPLSLLRGVGEQVWRVNSIQDITAACR
jgi:hypothetical protein